MKSRKGEVEIGALLVGGLLVSGVILALNSTAFVNVGHRAVLECWGHVDGVLASGFSFKNPDAIST